MSNELPATHSRRDVLVLHGPNLNLLGTREPGIYGAVTLAEIDQRLQAEGERLGLAVRCAQSNHEGALIDTLHDARGWAAGVLLNPAGYTHTSVALRDAISAIGLPVIEIHLSNTEAREPFPLPTPSARLRIGNPLRRTQRPSFRRHDAGPAGCPDPI